MRTIYRRCKKCLKQIDNSLLLEKVCIKCREHLPKEEPSDILKEEPSDILKDIREVPETVVEIESPISKRSVHFYDWDKHSSECTKCVDNSLVINRMEERIIKLESLVLGLMELVGKIHNDIEVSKSSE